MDSRDFYLLLLIAGLILCGVQRIAALPITVATTVSFEPSNFSNAGLGLHTKNNLQRPLIRKIKYNYPQEMTDETNAEFMGKLWSPISENVLLEKIGLKEAANEERYTVNPTPILNYYPNNFSLATVCMGSTIPYGEHKIMDWVRREIYKQPIVKHEFYPVIRMKMYTEGDSEECHSIKYSTFEEYTLCAMKRNQRMDSKVPKYPLHQKDQPQIE